MVTRFYSPLETLLGLQALSIPRAESDKPRVVNIV